MLTPLYEQCGDSHGDSGFALRLNWSASFKSHPPESTVAVEAIDNALRGWVWDLQDPRIPRNGLRWTRDYMPSQLRRALC